MAETAEAIQEIKEPAAPAEKAPGADNFFSTAEKDRESELNNFIKHMKTPREHVEAPGFDYPDEEEPADGDGPTQPGQEGESDKEMLDHFNFTPEHKYTAEFLLIQLDKLIAFGCGMFSGQPSDKYRRRKTRIQGEDYEAEILAALLKKYQMQLSLEWMFVSAIAIAYAPVVETAVKDRRIVQEQKARERRREEIETIANTVKTRS